MASAPAQPDRPLTLSPGQQLHVGVQGPRLCVGRWDPELDHRIICHTRIPHDGGDTQCAGCAARDRGRLLARDAYTDDRTYLLYLAWLGPGLVKVGLTAAERGHRRLLEQGALAFTELGRGPLPAVRAAERAIGESGWATERVRHQRKLHALWDTRCFTDGAATLKTAREHIIDAHLTDRIQPGPDTMHDNTAAFGLTAPLPDTYLTLTGLADPAGLAVQVRAIWGRSLITTDPATSQTLVIDTRLLAGYHLGPAPARSEGLTTRTHTRPPGDDRDQFTLF
ncbi:DUF2797 domain-containing protein [Nocardiopsis sp. NPDC049922]|uniref:DUF2797 domain-containing protein n=1 Tax=Nocardiopsis sp. NPDC049922 TaxID=3155157 RepID=UPI0033D594EE